MSIKRSYEDDSIERSVKFAKYDDETVKKHSLDSDEEDADEERKQRYDILDDDDIEGQEDGISGQDGEVKITPFNMKEEMEEGHFDTEGNFHWDKTSTIKDNWLENIDWIKVKESGQNLQTNDEYDDTLDSSTSSPFDQIAAYKQMLELMEEGETVAKALRRLGGNKTLSASERLKRKKAGLSIETNGDAGKVTELTELANRILTKTGNMNVYQESYQQIKNMIESKSKKNYDDALDMYADDFGEKEKERLENREENKASTSGTALDVAGSSEIVMWEYKLDKSSDKIQGPHTTEQMQKYVDEGFFKTEVWVRKVGLDGPFYSSKRIDFQLYL
ncbi:UNVERIFIED_CONTAM: hypothetical protein PYX00_000086 [Menopon gallinae]|uniref:GYF domain-containing protein n=1 Tax=Menopon gallinae TaxID=328185 RepID=A0AAW2I8W0_9NEOP